MSPRSPDDADIALIGLDGESSVAIPPSEVSSKQFAASVSRVTKYLTTHREMVSDATQEFISTARGQEIMGGAGDWDDETPKYDRVLEVLDAIDTKDPKKAIKACVRLGVLSPEALDAP